MKFSPIHFIKTALLVAVCLVLTACATPQQRYSQDYSSARQNFNKHNYRSAFTQLQRPAKAGDPNAQYALGYMYYNGQGTVANPAKARYWFQQAAHKGQPKAKKALQMMGQSNNGSNDN